MLAITHFIIGIFVGALFFGDKMFTILNFLIIIAISNGIDLDHLYKMNSRPRNHLRTFIQEPFSLLIIALPAGLILNYFFGPDPNYFWAVMCLYTTHIIADYVCIFETYPLDPFNKSIVKKEGMGIVVTLEKDFMNRKDEFKNKISEIYFIIGFIILDIILIYLNFFYNPPLFQL